MTLLSQTFCWCTSLNYNKQNFSPASQLKQRILHWFQICQEKIIMYQPELIESGPYPN